jgi:uncharacterized protein (TIGR00251 family)
VTFVGRNPAANHEQLLILGYAQVTSKSSFELETYEVESCDNDMKLWKTAYGIVLDVYVKPNSKRFRINTEEGELLVFCRETPVKGRVNRELVKELSRLFKRRVEIVSGFSSRHKKILVRDIEAKEAEQILGVATRAHRD